MSYKRTIRHRRKTTKKHLPLMKRHKIKKGGVFGIPNLGVRDFFTKKKKEDINIIKNQTDDFTGVVPNEKTNANNNLATNNKTRKKFVGHQPSTQRRTLKSTQKILNNNLGHVHKDVLRAAEKIPYNPSMEKRLNPDIFNQTHKYSSKKKIKK